MHVHRSFRKYKFLLSLPRLISQKKSAHVQHLLTFRIDEAFMGNHSKCKLPLHIWRKSFFAANIYKKYEF